jgi:UDP-N-acetylglucosamine--N-acetylmuramyl-(pentapeptide) pyrophosphoryl-undecaprenol N-acetylglucosamine transferase
MVLSTYRMTHPQASAGPGRETLIAFTGGGTAGHVFPGIAVAEELGCRILWIGSSSGVERQLALDAGLDFRGIPAGKLRRYLSLRNLTDVVRILAGIVVSVHILRKERPALLFSKGGFVSVPPVIAARLCGIPAWTHESDYDPGLATRINLRFCEKLLVSFPQTVGFIAEGSRGKVAVTGNPVRSALYRADSRRGRRLLGCDDATPVLFVIGGSLGSSFINRLVGSCLSDLLPQWFVVHQMGAADYAPSHHPRYRTAAFFSEELPDIMAAADLVVSRAGANTLSELAALGKPSILIPLPESGSRGDQLRNAEVFRSSGAAVVLREADASPAKFLEAVGSMLADQGARHAMAEQAAALAGGALAGGARAAGRPAAAIAEMIRQRLA